MGGTNRERRAHERLAVKLPVRFAYEHMLHSIFYGTVNNISPKGMLIRTGTCFPTNTEIRIFVHKEKTLLFNSKVRHVVRDDGFYNAMGVEVLGPNELYAEFVESLRSEDS